MTDTHDDTQALPDFPYHPDPVATGSIAPSDTECICCERVRGFIYLGPVYAVDEIDEELCPWCIADGSAAERFGAQFTEVEGVVPLDTVRAIEQRTPGFSGWQQERWLTHCGDGAIFRGHAGAAELAPHPDAIAAIEADLDRYRRAPAQVDHFMSSLDKDGQPTGYAFECRICGAWLAYADFT
ncbi:CbrC family protein [Streptomyces sp. SID5785]|uniref:CbrC family protein n=1 Tax=Streptomyces sp. SID5785 TaxID=2690309 RepID=UPI001F34E1FF|nr:CbrC family protein [Streptomyces sp. SID5785]